VIGIIWPVPPEIDNAELERRLFVPKGFYPEPTRPMPDWSDIHAELRRRGVTLLLLLLLLLLLFWEEYRTGRPDGYGVARHH
jgi:hypothetical protein